MLDAFKNAAHLSSRGVVEPNNGRIKSPLPYVIKNNITGEFTPVGNRLAAITPILCILLNDQNRRQPFSKKDVQLYISKTDSPFEVAQSDIQRTLEILGEEFQVLYQKGPLKGRYPLNYFYQKNVEIPDGFAPIEEHGVNKYSYTEIRQAKKAGRNESVRHAVQRIYEEKSDLERQQEAYLSPNSKKDYISPGLSVKGATADEFQRITIGPDKTPGRRVYIGKNMPCTLPDEKDRKENIHPYFSV